ncbi:ICMT-domain-containing protein [Cubamyces sp. BRFM 1775]|nr:ICMT-domain-containing protein [Cubamyces sp. BRFM 1775]
MSSVDLLKIPLLLSAAVIVHKATIAPNPPPKSDAVARFKKRDTIAGIVNWVPTINMTLIWSITFVEVAVILANRQAATPVLSLLTFGRPSLAHKLAVSPLFVAGWLIATFGSLLRIACFHHLGRQFTYNLSIVDGHKLITDGPYAFVRHPSYTAWMALTISAIVMLTAPGSWLAECGPLQTTVGRALVALYSVYNAYILIMLIPRMKREDDALKAQFGEQWVQWTKRTPCRLIPGIY